MRSIPSVDGTGGCLLVFAALVCSVAMIYAAEQPAEPVTSIAVVRNLNGPRYYLSEVVKVVDGDTVDLKFKVWPDITLEKRVRFDNINTWEVRGENKEKGFAAKDFLIKLLSKGKVYFKTSGECGNFGRTLGNLHVLVNGEMIDVSLELRNNGHEKN